MSKIVKIKQTCMGCPSQWDAWDQDGNYLYLRYRHGHGTVQRYPSEAQFWEGGPDGGRIVSFDYGHPLDGVIDLETFCDLAGLQLADDVEHRNPYEEWS